MGERTGDPGWACGQTVNRFFRCLDENRVKDASELFTEEGVWFRRGDPVTGRVAILAALEQRPAGRVTRHLVTNTLVDEDGSCMVATYDVTIFSHDGAFATAPPLAPPHTLLCCEDRLVETTAGWRFVSRSSRVIFAAH